MHVLPAAPALPSRTAAAFWLFGAPLLVFLGLALVAVVLGVLGLDGLSAIGGLCALVLPVIPVFIASSFLRKSRTMLHDARTATARGDGAMARRLSTKVLATVYRADVRAAAVYELARAASAGGERERAARYFADVVPTLPAGLRTGAVHRVMALSRARLAIELAHMGQIPEAMSAATEARANLELYHGGLASNATPFGHRRLDIVLDDLEGRVPPKPLVMLASAFVAAKAGDVSRGRQFVERDALALAGQLGPQDRNLLGEVAPLLGFAAVSAPLPLRA